MEIGKKGGGLTDTVIDSRYRLIKEIGRGASCNVYIAEDGLMKRVVAIKLYIRSDPSSMRYFDSEARAAIHLSHPNIVEVYDIVSTDKYKYIVMEYVNGVTLAEYIRRNRRLTQVQCMNVAMQVLSALIEAHKNGIVHRDIKPENIMIDRSGNVKLTDFGISKTKESDSFRSTDKGVGSVYYISPEQAQGGVIDRRTDIYSLGIVMYQMLTGRVPFDSYTASAVAMMHITDMPIPVREINPEISAGLEHIVFRAIQKDVSTRYKDAQSMLSALVSLKRKLDKGQRGSETESDEPVARPQSKRRGTKRSGYLGAIIASASAVAVLVAVCLILLL